MGLILSLAIRILEREKVSGIRRVSSTPEHSGGGGTTVADFQKSESEKY